MVIWRAPRLGWSLYKYQISTFSTPIAGLVASFELERSCPRTLRCMNEDLDPSSYGQESCAFQYPTPDGVVEGNHSLFEGRSKSLPDDKILFLA